MASMNKASRTIFVGNISHEGSDEEIGALMNQIGPTVSMRIMKDRDTGRRKGFAFIEYQDADTAMNALRSLAEYDFHGRPLRVSLAQEENKPTSQRGTPPVSAGAQTRTAVSDPVAAVVNATPSIQLFDLLQRTRDFVAQQPQQAQALLISQPPLCYALSLGLDRLLGNLVDDTETSKLSSAAESTPMEVSSQQMQPQQAQQMQQMQQMQPQQPALVMTHQEHNMRGVFNHSSRSKMRGVFDRNGAPWYQLPRNVQASHARPLALSASSLSERGVAMCECRSHIDGNGPPAHCSRACLGRGARRPLHHCRSPPSRHLPRSRQHVKRAVRS